LFYALGVLLIRLLGIFVVCLALASCAGRVSLSPATDAGLASRGWEEARNLAYYAPSGVHLTKGLICRSPRCGGPGFVMTGTASLPNGSALGFRGVMANRSLTDAKLLQALRLLSEGSPNLAGIDGHLIDARKRANSVELTFSFAKSTPQTGRIVGLARADVRGTDMSVVVAGGPTMASARQRLGLLPN
jgi:hypothetical protein